MRDSAGGSAVSCTRPFQGDSLDTLDRRIPTTPASAYIPRKHQPSELAGHLRRSTLQPYSGRLGKMRSMHGNGHTGTISCKRTMPKLIALGFVRIGRV